MEIKDVVAAIIEKGGPVALVSFFWYLSERKAWETVDRLSASVVKLALLRARSRDGGEGRKS